MAAFSTLYDYIFPELPGATQDQIDKELRLTLRDFLQRTMLYKSNITAVVTSGLSANLSPPANTEVSDVIGEVPDRWIKFGTVKLYPADTVDLRDAFVDHTTATGSPSTYVVEDQAIRVYPSASGSVTAKCVLIPTITATVFPDFINRKEIYRESIAAGTKYRMMSKPNVRWSSPDLAMLYLRMYERGVGVGSANQFRNETRKPLRVRTMYGIG